MRSKLGELYFDLIGEPQAFNDDERLIQAIAKQLSAGCRLLVLDDVWLQKELRPFMRVARGCAFLFTTRNLDLAVQTQAQAIAMDRMKADEAVQLLSAGISPAPSQDQKSALGAIATRLGHWPLLLELANAALRRRAIRLLHQKGMSISDELLLHLSPLGWEHINLTGDYVWHANRRVAKVRFRPLRQPREAPVRWFEAVQANS